jgi:hypothetical protein
MAASTTARNAKRKLTILMKTWELPSLPALGDDEIKLQREGGPGDESQ